MKDTANNLALGLGVAVLGFALYRYFKGQGSTAAPTSTVTNAPTSPNGGATWSLLNFGGSTDGTTPLAVDNPYSSFSWNPDALSGAMSQDLTAALAKAGESGINSYGFTLP
ncbi:hypothetical protein G3O06_26945 [Burkholderia sp. Ac-20345]|uniref:hypothetical protein n=1 Tax=Burkholderia sp. Ac-20345 TaxID=2703891 RepID=UPI00197C6B8C|nr:hypothetical protein [Burkholderia sp. Ac-20345]MBN3781154.1 hypothetical protein [Burkholderia sp. Ac-20345]